MTGDRAGGRRARSGLGRPAAVGAVGGVAGAVVMAMYAMVVSVAVSNVGFFTPMYHIASGFISPTAMTTSMERAAGGAGYYFVLGPALIGMVVHLMTGAVAGAIFGVAAALLRAPRAFVVLGGVGYGLVVMVVNSFVGLPIVATLFGGGQPISNMPRLVGWGTFTVEHALFGLVLGLVVAWSLRSVPAEAGRLAPRTG